MDPYKQHLHKLKKNKKVIKKSKSKRRQKPSRKSKFPIAILIYSLLISVGAFYGLDNIDKLESYISKVSINFIGETKAQNKDSEKNDAAESIKEEQTAVSPKSELTLASNRPVKKDVNYFKMLEEKEVVMSEKEKQLKNLESNLQQQKEELLVKIKELEQLRADISLSLKDKVDTDKKIVDKLVQVYANMKPKSAAPVLEKMNEELAVKILHNMKKKNAAAILNVIKSERARYLTEKIAGYQE